MGAPQAGRDRRRRVGLVELTPEMMLDRVRSADGRLVLVCLDEEPLVDRRGSEVAAAEPSAVYVPLSLDDWGMGIVGGPR